MSKFNPKASAENVRNHPEATVNFEQGLAFKMNAKTRLYSQVVTSLIGEDKFYQAGEDHDQEIFKDIAEVATIDPEFILRLAAYARNEMYLRSGPVMLLAEAAAIPACKPYVRRWTPLILRRADEPGELFAYWVGKYGSKKQFPNSLKKGIADALFQFDEYQLEKYNRDGTVKLRDVLKVCHPAPSTAQQNALYRYLVTGEIDRTLLPKLAAKQDFLLLTEFGDEARRLITEASVTWEVALAKFGNKKEVWEALNLPFMAMLRNLRNLIQADADMTSAIERLQNPEAVRRSKQFPFRFLSAYRELEAIPGSDQVLGALSKAITLSVENLPRLLGVTLVACDNSGSMQDRLSQKGTITYADIANLFGALSYRFCENAIVGAFGTDWARVQFNPADSVFTNMERIRAADTKGMSTNGYRVIDYLVDSKIKVDRIILLSDMQCYDAYGVRGSHDNSVAAALLRYRSAVNPKVKLHSIDLAGYGTSLVPQNASGVSMIAGWSDRIFKFMPAYEADRETAVREVENYSPVG